MHLLSEFGAWLIGIAPKVLNFVKGILVTLANNPTIQDIAVQEVKNAEEAALAAAQAGSILTGAQKFAQAQVAVVAQLQAQGVPIAMNAINIAIEGAVANLKNSQVIPDAQPAAAQAPAGATS